MNTNEELYVIFHYLKNDKDAAKFIAARQQLDEGRTVDLPGNYYARFDRGIPPTTQNHLHIFKKGNQIIAMNQDGSPHDNAGGLIPKSIFPDLKKTFPEWNWPSNRLVESENLTVKTLLKRQCYKEHIKMTYLIEKVLRIAGTLSDNV